MQNRFKNKISEDPNRNHLSSNFNIYNFGCNKDYITSFLPRHPPSSYADDVNCNIPHPATSCQFGSDQSEHPRRSSKCEDASNQHRTWSVMETPAQPTIQGSKTTRGIQTDDSVLSSGQRCRRHRNMIVLEDACGSENDSTMVEDSTTVDDSSVFGDSGWDRHNGPVLDNGKIAKQSSSTAGQGTACFKGTRSARGILVDNSVLADRQRCRKRGDVIAVEDACGSGDSTMVDDGIIVSNSSVFSVLGSVHNGWVLDSGKTVDSSAIGHASNFRSRMGGVRSSFRQLRGLSNVNFGKWKKPVKQKSRPTTESAEDLLCNYYKPFGSVRRPLLQQVQEVLLHRYQGNTQYLQEHFLRPISGLLYSIKHEYSQRQQFNPDKSKPNKKSSWPLCSRGCVIIHLSALDPKHLRSGDFYFLAHPEDNILLIYKTSNHLLQRSLNAKKFSVLMASMVSSGYSKSLPEESDEEEDNEVEQDLSNILLHLMVSVDRGIRRIEVGQVAKELWKWNGGGRKNRRVKTATRDSWVQTSPVDGDLSSADKCCSEQPSVAPLASEEEFSSDTEARRQSSKLVAENSSSLADSHSESTEDISSISVLSGTTSICQLEEAIVQSQIAILPGCRDLCGRSVVYFSLERLRNVPSATPYQIAQQIMYFTTIPKRDVSRLGILLLVDARDASSEDSTVLEKTLSFIEACAPRTVSLVLAWQKQCQSSVILPTSPLHRTSIRFEAIVNANQLLKYVRRTQLLPEFGGSYVYNHEDWINFHKVLDPFMSRCHVTGQHLLSVMKELRTHQLPSSSSLSSAMIEHHKKQIIEALEDEQLKLLESEGDAYLVQLQTYQKRSCQNHDYRECFDKCSHLYRQLKKILARLTKLADKRLSRLQECMMLRTFEEQSSHVLSWLCHKGDETLKRHNVLAENFNAIRDQETEFEKFYFVAMRQIERGNDLIDEAPKPKIVSSAGINGLTSVLKSQLEEFSERLEDARENLEDSRRCYHLLDKSYEWALETMSVVSCMKADTSISLEALSKKIQNLEDYFKNHPPFKDETFQEMVVLSKKLKNDRLISQCEVAKKKCHETVELVQNKLASLKDIKSQLEEPSTAPKPRSIDKKPYVWMPVISSMLYKAPSQTYLQRGSSLYGSQQILREATGSYTSFPSSYYPIASAKDNEHSFRHAHLRKSYTPCESDQSKDGKRERAAHTTESVLGKRLSLDQSWKICEDELGKATEEVRVQNNHLEQFSESITKDDSDIEADEDVADDSESPKAIHQKPASVNMHLVRCASCSDFEELLSTKNAELEAEKKTKKILKLIMREMIQTERDYVKSLEYIIENYVPLLQRNDIPQTLRGQRNVLFGNIEKIYEFHNCYFLQELEQYETSAFAVGQCFLKYEPQFYLYALYNKNKPKSDQLMAEYGNNFFKEKQCELGDKMDLASYLLKPVQRMGKYALLLKQLLKECPEGDCDYGDLKAAEEMVHFQLRHGNDLLAMDALRDCDVNVKEQGRLLRQDEFLVWQGKSHKTLRHLFLFEDLILFSKARHDPVCRGHDSFQYKHSIKTSDIGLTEQVGDSQTKFEIWFRKRKVHGIYTLQAPSAEVKNAWVQDISKILWKQALRNRELRLAEMSSMGIGNKPCLDISPSQDQICDRSISLQQLNKAPRFRNSIAISGCDSYSSGNKRPESIISLSSMSSTGSNSSHNSTPAPTVGIPATLMESKESETRRFSMAQRSQCSAESGIFTDASTSGESFGENDFLKRKEVVRSDSILSRTSLTTIADDS